MNIKTKLLFLAIISSVLIINGCKKNDDPAPTTPGGPGTPADNFTYIKVGNKSIFNVMVSGFLAGTDSLEILQNYGSGYYSTAMLADTGFIYKEESRLADLDSLTGAKHTYVKTSPVLNDVYNNFDNTIVRKVVGVNQSVTVPAGTFTTVTKTKQYTIGQTDTIFYYMDRTAGLVKMEVPSINAEMLLKSKNF